MTEIIISDHLIHLRNDRVSYVIGILEGGIAAHLYFGKRLEHFHAETILRRHALPTDFSFSPQNCALNHTPQEYPSFGLGDLREGALIVRAESGTASCDLRYAHAEAEEGKFSLPGLPASFGGEAKTLRLHLFDELLQLRVTLLYAIFEDCDVIARSVLLENAGSEPLQVERAASFCLELPDDRYDLITLSGDWARERDMIRRRLVPGQQAVGSIRGASGLHTSPLLILARPEATEAQGEVIAASLVYSGSFYAGAEVDPRGTTRLMMGLNDRHFSWKLEPGASLALPEAVLVYSETGLDGMSAQFHALCSRHVARGKYARAPRPILLNNWEATYFSFDEEKLLRIAEKAAETGIELFVLDDGWFGHRDDDHTSLGDWVVDPRKLPHGLRHVADGVHRMGMKFGLWFEPEMVSPDSDLYLRHPDWALHIDGRTPIEGRNQLVLDLSREDVCEYIYTCVSTILRENGIDYVKWDMNRNFSNIGSSSLPADRMAELPHRYMLGLYGILERLQADFPEVLFESCASGGGRFDLGMLYYMPQTWCSDNTDALSRCRIQYATSLVFPQSAIGSHVSAVPNHQTGRITPISTRIHVAMGGCFGFELDLNRLSEEDLALIRAAVSREKEHRLLCQYGAMHRLLSPFEGHDTAWVVVSPDQKEAIFTLVRDLSQPNADAPLVRLRGLDAKKVYLIAETGEIYGGDELMQSGLSVELPQGDAVSVSYTLSALDHA